MPIRRRWQFIVLDHPVDLVLDRFLTEERAEWLAATTIPLRSVTFRRESSGVGWDVLSDRVAADERSFGASRRTLQVCP